MARKHKKETVGLRLELDRHFATNFGEITRAKALEDFEHFKLLINANSTAINNDFERSPDLKTDTENSQLKELEDCLANLRGAISQLKSDFHSLKRHSDSLKTVQLNNEGIQTEELLENNFYEIPNHQIEKQKETNSLIPSIKLPENFEENEADSVNSISTQSDICNLVGLHNAYIKGY